VLFKILALIVSGSSVIISEEYFSWLVVFFTVHTSITAKTTFLVVFREASSSQKSLARQLWERQMSSFQISISPFDDRMSWRHLIDTLSVYLVPGRLTCLLLHS